MTKIDPRARDLWHELHSMGVRTVLAGGACRDVYHGKVPKDYDFMVLGNDWMRHSLHLETLGRGLADPGTYKELIQASYSGNLRCGDVWEFQYSGLQVNIIFPCLDGDGPWKDAQTALDHFDTSLNVIAYDFIRETPYIDPRFAGRTGKVTFISDPDRVGFDRTYKRFTRLVEKYPQYDWSEVQNYLDPHKQNPFVTKEVNV